MVKEGAILPTRGTPLLAELDLSSIEDKYIEVGERDLTGTGLAMDLPLGIYGRIAPRSGLAYKADIIVDAGVIDGDYRGQIKILLVNNGKEVF